MCAALGAAAAEVVYTDYAPSNIVPTYENGHLIVYEQSGLRVHGPDGNVRYRFKPPTGQVLNAALRRDGTGAAAVGDLEGKPGAIVYLDASGSVTRVVETPEYNPVSMSFAHGGTLWVIGASSSDDYHILRHYSKDGIEMGRHVLRSSVRGEGQVRASAGNWQVRTSSNRVGVYLFAYEKSPRYWVETTLDGLEVGRWAINFDGYPAAFTQSGDVFARTVGGTLVLDRSDGKWKHASVTSRGLLVGAVGDELVFLQDNGAVERVPAPSLLSAN
jgi:hypothetical protein